MQINYQSGEVMGQLLGSATRLGYVDLTVQSLDRQVAFYTQVLNLNLHWRKEAKVALGTETEVLLYLNENTAAQRVQNTTGMYHFAILYPNRKELARVTARLFSLRYPIAPTDHGQSKSIYLTDPEGNEIELYVRSLDDATLDIINGQPVMRYADGRIGNGRDPLNVKALLSELSESDRLDTTLPENTQIGHIHLYASKLNDSMHFYKTVLGFQEDQTYKNFRMAEVGLDKQQPHVIAWNTWKGNGIPPTPADALGMRHFTLVLSDTSELQRIVERIHKAGITTEQTPEGILVRDPSQINIILTDQMPSIK